MSVVKIGHIGHAIWPSGRGHKLMAAEKESLKGGHYVVLYVDVSGGFGGAINSLYNTLVALDRKKFQPVVVSSQRLGAEWDKVVMHHVPYTPYYRFRFMRSIRERIAQSGIPALFRRVLNGVCFLTFVGTTESRYFVRLWKVGRLHKPALIHLNNHLNSQLSGMLLARTLGIPCVSHQRDYESRSWVTRWLGGCVDHHIAISDSVKQNLIGIGIDPAKISVVRDAVDIEAWNPDRKHGNLRGAFGVINGERLIGMFGRVVRWKGQHVFVRAMQEVCKVSQDVRGFIVGDESDGDSAYMEEVVQQLQRLELDSRIFMTGYRDDVRGLMSMMDIVVHASVRPEPFGMVIIEAMAMGKPVVATEGGGPSEIITHGKSGILVPRGDSESLASAIRVLLENPTYAKELGEAGRRVVVERFTSSQQAQEIMQIYRSLLGDGSW